jgi:glucose dehydrogenase
MRVPGSGSSSGSSSASSCLRVFVVAFFAVASLNAQVTFDRLVRAAQEPHNWLSYSGGYFSQRYTELAQITPDNVKNLESAWIYQLTSREPTSTRFEVTPIVVDGIMYIVQPPNDIIALDAVTGRPFWTYSYNPSPQARPCCGRG